MKVVVKVPSVTYGINSNSLDQQELNLVGQDETYVIRVLLRDEDPAEDAPANGGDYTL